jgi:hypothetical protein
MKLVLAAADPNEIDASDVERFWNELVPKIVGENRKSLDTLPDVVPAAKAHFGRKGWRAQQRLHGRFSLMLVAKLEPLYLGRMSKVLIPVKTYFHLWMLAAHIIGKGKDAYLAALADPMSVVKDVPEMNVHTGLYYLSMFRVEAMTMDVQKMRLLQIVSAPYDYDKKQAFLASTEADWPAVPRTLHSLAQTMSGYYCVAMDLVDQMKGPRFDKGQPELYPSFRELESGEVVVRGYAEVPPGVKVPIPTSHSEPPVAVAE